MTDRDPWEHIERAEEHLLRALEGLGPSPNILAAVRELTTARYVAGRGPERRAAPRDELEPVQT